MKEILALHERILAQPDTLYPEEGVEFSRDEIDELIDELPPEFESEITALQASINVLVPDDFDYFAFVGCADSPAEFSLTYNGVPAEPTESSYDPERSLLEQLPQTDWIERRKIAEERDQRLEQMLYSVNRSVMPMASAKGLQKTFREETKDFIKEKRADPTKIHVLGWDELDGLMEYDFANGAAFREALPDMIEDGSEIITVVAHGKPLPVERIDALKAEAQKTLRERPLSEDEVDDVIDIEAEEVAKEPSLPPAARATEEIGNAPGSTEGE